MKVLRACMFVGALGLVPACASDDKDSSKDEMSPTEDAKDGGDKEAEQKAAPPPPAAAPAPAPTPAEPPPSAPVAAAAPAPAAPALVFDGPKVVRYVRVVAVKIHKEPAKESEVVGWVHRGAKIQVIINGDWAKLESGHYVSAKFLAEKAP